MFKSGTIWHSLWRGIMVFVIMGLTAAMAGNPEWGDVTIGSVLVVILHYFEKQVIA